MIRVSVLYPNCDGARFDMDYYCGRHVAMVRQRLGAACKAFWVDGGLAGASPGAIPAYLAMGHLLFDSVESFQVAFAPHAHAIMGDAPNFTNVEPVVQISEI